jgi:MFS family permease
MYQIFVTFGFCVAFWTGYGTYHIEGERSWRISLGVQTIPGGLLLFGIYFIPESPRWLIYKDRTEEALRILASLRSRGNENDVDVRMEYTSIVQDVSFDKMAYKHRFLSLLTKGNDNNRKRTLLGVGIHTFTQLSGINAIL